MGIAFYLAAAALAAQAPDDLRANEGAAVFFNLCGSTVTGVETPVDPTRFKFTPLSPETAAKIRPMSKGQKFWDVHGLQSDLHALVHIEANGVCVVEIVDAGEQAIRAGFTTDLRDFALRLGGTLDQQPDKVKSVEGKPMTASEWRLTTPSRSFLIGLTTYPDARFMTQHIMTVTAVR